MTRVACYARFINIDATNEREVGTLDEQFGVHTTPRFKNGVDSPLPLEAVIFIALLTVAGCPPVFWNLTADEDAFLRLLVQEQGGGDWVTKAARLNEFLTGARKDTRRTSDECFGRCESRMDEATLLLVRGNFCAWFDCKIAQQQRLPYVAVKFYIHSLHAHHAEGKKLGTLPPAKGIALWDSSTVL